MIDYNCYVGQWPFHKLRRYTFEDLKATHKENGIDYGYVSSLHSIFYNDFYESEKELHEQIKNTSYKHVVTVNPTLGSCAHTLRRCIKEFDTAGVRILPGYHGYKITSDILKPVMDIIKENKLAVFVSARMIDERVTHMLYPEIISTDDIGEFITANTDVPVVLCHLKDAEANVLCDVIARNKNVFVDVTGFSSNLILGDDKKSLYKKAVLGSGFPLKNVKSAVMRIETEVRQVCDNSFDSDVLQTV